MKCPHCGIEIRDTMTVCMYCGGKIPQRKGTPLPPSGKAPEIGARGPEKGSAAALKRSDGSGEDDKEEEEGGLSAFLQPGELVLIGSLNVSVKKFFFHAYLTNQRIFLIDTQEKKLKVTAKDIPLSTITGSGVESSETSDPVLVLSIRSTDDEVKTMKLVFTGNGLDRSGEVDEWVELLNDQIQPKKQKRPAPAKRHEPEPEIPEEEPGAAVADEGYEAPAQRSQAARQEPRPAKRPVKDHEKQPPVKRLLPVYQTPSDEEMEDLPELPRTAPRRVTASPEDLSADQQAAPVREIPSSREQAVKPVRKVEVQSAMRSALKSAIPTPRSAAEKPAPGPVAVRKPVHVRAEPVALKEQGEEIGTIPDDQTSEEEETAGPVFCQNCGKKLPAAANFCPGCGARIAASRERTASRPPAKGIRKQEEGGTDRDVVKAEEARPARPAVKKAPKGSEMTILHKFLRR